MTKSEFTVQSAYQYNHKSAPRWIFSHLWRYKFLLIGTFVLSLAGTVAYTLSPVLIGKAAEEIINPTAGDTLIKIALAILFALIFDGLAQLGHSLSLETLAQRLERDAREELYGSLLGKSQTFHDRQRVGDIMARATDDVRQLNPMVNPGFSFIFGMFIGFAVPILTIASIRMELILVPLVFTAAYVIVVRRYIRQLDPVMQRQRSEYGKMNAGLEESISGIEVVKASAQESFERRKFRTNARLYRDLYVRQGYIESRYLPLLLLGVAIGMAFLHAMMLYQQGLMTIPQIVAFMGLIGLLRWPTFSSIFSFSLVRLGIAGAERILSIIRAETELDQNVGGHTASIQGDIVFEHVTFGYDKEPLLEDIAFQVKPGETVAIVGQTGSGKSTLTQLVNRTYEATKGRVLIDGIDVRDWNLTSLRSQISAIEQDVFLFSRTLAENIAFGMPGATREQIEQAAREAQAHDFIMSFKEGYETMVGERGVTLSGGQRQRIALARAFLSNPRILILDDSTSAIDSATEDEIQKAIRRAQQGRTTLLITHRLSQIRWADHILVIDQGTLVASGSHEELLRRSSHYRRIFARYEVDLPPLEVQQEERAAR